MADIGTILFVEILQMSQYPGSPFTGNIFQDLIMFLFVPSVFIILIIYMTVARILPSQMTKFRLLLGIAVYLFIIAGGYYPAFALLAGPYFIFLIFVLGLLYFVLEHFRGGGGRSSFVRAGHGQERYPVGGSKLKHLIGMPTINPGERSYLQSELRKLNDRLEKIDAQIERNLKAGIDTKDLAIRRDDLEAERQRIIETLEGGYRKAA